MPLVHKINDKAQPLGSGAPQVMTSAQQQGSFLRYIIEGSGSGDVAAQQQKGSFFRYMIEGGGSGDVVGRRQQGAAVVVASRTTMTPPAGPSNIQEQQQDGWADLPAHSHGATRREQLTLTQSIGSFSTLVVGTHLFNGPATEGLTEPPLSSRGPGGVLGGFYRAEEGGSPFGRDALIASGVTVGGDDEPDSPLYHGLQKRCGIYFDWF